MPQRITTGIREIDAKLDNLVRRDANKVARAAIQAGMTSIAKSIRSAVDSAQASPEMKRALKKLVGKRLVTGGRSARFGVAAKVGLGVGKKSAKQQKQAASDAGSGTKHRSSRRGVGLSANNVHWPALGTAARFTASKSLLNGKRRSKSGGKRKKGSAVPAVSRHYTGMMPQIAVVRAAGGGLASVRAVMETKARQKIEDLVK